MDPLNRSEVVGMSRWVAYRETTHTLLLAKATRNHILDDGLTSEHQPRSMLLSAYITQR